MNDTQKILLLGTLLAAITAGLGLNGLRGWDGQFGGHWTVVLGFTFVIPLFWTE